MIVHFTDNYSTSGDFQFEVNSLLKDIRAKAETVAVFYPPRVSTTQKTKSNTDLLYLISVLCNHSNQYSQGFLNQQDYLLPFPLLLANDDFDWKFRMNESIYSCCKIRNYILDDTVLLETENYRIKGSDCENTYAEIISPEWMNKAELHIKALIIIDMKNYLEKLSYTARFYNIILLASKDLVINKLSDKDVNQLVELLKNNPEVLKLVSIFANEAFQEKIAPYLFELKIDVNENEPDELISILLKQLTIWQNEPEKEKIKHLASVKNDLLMYDLQGTLGNVVFPLHNFMLAAKLESALKESETHKRPKI